MTWQSDEKRHSIMIKVRLSDLEKIDKIADAMDLKRTDIVRLALVDYLSLRESQEIRGV